MLSFRDLQDEVKRRATRDQSGTDYTTAVKNLINASLFRIANEAAWRPLRRVRDFRTVAPFSTGTVSVTEGSSTWTFSGANIITGGVHTGRRIKVTGSGASSTLYEIDTITGENECTTKLVYDGSDISGSSYEILGQELYNLPIQTSRTAILWHEAWGYPYAMQYVTDRAFYEASMDFDDKDIPTIYRMWGEDCVINQPRQSSTISAVSTEGADTTAQVIIFGTVSGYPDSETLTLNGTSAQTTTKVFDTVERVAKDASTDGLVTVSADSGNTTVAVIPVGDIANAMMYKKIQIFPTPDKIYNIKVHYYKDPARLVNDDDVHELGQDFDELIILMATAKLQGEQSKRDIEAFFTMFKDEIKVLRRKNADKLDWLPRLQRPSMPGVPRLHPRLSFNQLGSKYGPAIRW